MHKRVIIGGSLALVLLIGGQRFWSVFSHRPGYRAELLLAIRPFNTALLLPAFERQIISANPGVIGLDFQISTFGIAPRLETNGVMRLVAAGSTVTEAEQAATKAADGVCTSLQKSYGTTATILSQAHNYSAAAVHRPFRLRFRRDAREPFPTAGRVYFQRQGISIDPGDGWMRHYVLGEEPICDPILMGEGRFNGDNIRTELLGPYSTNVETRLAAIRRSSRQQPGLIQSSWKEEPFTTDSGLHGLHASFVSQLAVPNTMGTGTLLHSPTTHYYLVTNAHSRCAVLVYNTLSGTESEKVHRMVCSTLRLD